MSNLVTKKQDLYLNAQTLQSDLHSENFSARAAAKRLLQDGVCFVTQSINGEIYFTPSRFAGYKENTLSKHLANKMKDGRTTNEAINAILGFKPVENIKIEEAYIEFCERYDIAWRAEAPFGNLRKFWSLPASDEYLDTMSNLEEKFYLRVVSSLDNDSDRKIRLKDATKKPKLRIVTVATFDRNPDVVAEVLSIAQGVCMKCKLPAPFNRRNGNPYLEVHHIVRLADGGDDSVENAEALCPNCHREKHYA